MTDGTSPSNEQADFRGSLATDDTIPTVETQRKIAEFVVLDKHGKSLTFKSLYEGEGTAKRVLVVFIRHFYCGICQEYIRSLVSSSINPQSLLSLSTPTSIVIIGCGDTALIDFYREATSCPFEIYADPTRKLYSELRMIETLTMSKERPKYMNKSMWATTWDGITQGLGQVRKGLALKSGNMKQVGGEFLYEETANQTTTTTTTTSSGDEGGDGREGGRGEHTKQITWCHRMRTTSDHTEIADLEKVLGFNATGGEATTTAAV